jgi:hypothetical protein
MQVDGISPGNGHAYGLQKVHPKEPEAEETAAVTGEDPGGGEEKGVIRLLQEGHFKGVADLRLRINFHDELTGIEAAQAQAVAEEKVGGVVESVGGIVDSFLADNELTEEQVAAVQEAKESFVQAVTGTEDPAGAVEDAFAALVAALQALVPPPPEEEAPPPEEPGEEPPGEEPPGEPEPPTEPQVDWQAFIDNLQSAYSEAMEDLTSSLSAVTALPPLSEPSGNGVAYEKFLAIYNDLWGIEPAGEMDETEPPPPEPEPEPPEPEPPEPVP